MSDALDQYWSVPELRERMVEMVGSQASTEVAELRAENGRLRAERTNLRAALRIIRDSHAKPHRPGASCAEGCGGRWPCVAWAEADDALNDDG